MAVATEDAATARREYQREYRRRRYAEDPEFRERQLAYSRKYWAEHREYQTQKSRAHRDRLREIKMEKGCTDCGFREHPDALQFDHVRGPNLLTGRGFGQNWSKSRAFIQAELDKCEVVCANCHAIRTAKRRSVV